MNKPSNPAPLYPAIGWVGNLLLFAFNLCVLPRAPPGLRPIDRGRRNRPRATVGPRVYWWGYRLR